MAMEYLWSWISPGAALFLFCNVLIGAIVVTSRGGGEQGGRTAASTRRLCRSASSMVLDRLRSLSIFSVHPDDDPQDPSSLLELQEAEQQPPEAAVAEPAAAIPTPAAGSAPVAAEEVGEDDKKPVASAAAELSITTKQLGGGGACRREAVLDQEGKAALNERAEQFIRQFREDLKLQRLNSIINYTRALRRRAAAPSAIGQ